MQLRFEVLSQAVRTSAYDALAGQEHELMLKIDGSPSVYRRCPLALRPRAFRIVTALVCGSQTERGTSTAEANVGVRIRKLVI